MQRTRNLKKSIITIVALTMVSLLIWFEFSTLITRYFGIMPPGVYVIFYILLFIGFIHSDICNKIVLKINDMGTHASKSKEVKINYLSSP